MKLSVGVQTDGRYKGRLSLRKGEGVGEGCSQRDCAAWRNRTPHLNPVPLAEGKGETNGMRLTIGEHYLEASHTPKVLLTGEFLRNTMGAHLSERNPKHEKI